MMIDLNLIQEFAPQFVAGIIITLQIAMASCFIGILMGCILGILLSRPIGIFYYLIMAYVTVIRGTPMLIQVAGMYYMLSAAGYSIPAFWSAIISIGLNSGVYMSQIVLAGIKSVPKGQHEAAKVLGLTGWQTMWHIVLPQAIKAVVPAFGNELVTLVKDSSLASTIGVYELTKQSEMVTSQTFDVPTVYLVVGCCYLMITSILGLIVSWLDKKLQHHA